MHPEAQTLNSVSPVRLWSLPYVFLMLSNALLFMVFEMMLPTLPLFVSKIGGDAAQIGLVTGCFTVSAILVRFFAGKLAAIVNKKYLLIVGVAICALTTGAYYLAPNVLVLVAIRLVNGAGFGLASTYFATLVAEVIPRERRGEGIGYFGVGETVAISVGPMIGIAMLDLYGYQRLFLGGMAILLLAALSIFLVKRKAKEEAAPQDVRVKVVEKRVLFPSLLALFTGFAASSIMSYLSLYALDKNFTHVGLFFFIIAMSSFVVRFFSGNLFDKHGPGMILIPGAILNLIGLFILFHADSNTAFFVSASLYGLGFGAIFPAIQTWCLNLVEEHEHEDAMASFFNFFDIGIGSGAVLLGLLAARYSYQSVFLAALFCYAAFLILYTAYKLRKNKVR
jgi:predicted MFS family arabinose efflux permease